jgi:hypothetical protein
MLLLVCLRNHCLIHGCEDAHLFSSKSSVVLTVMLKALVCFEITFTYGVKVHLHSLQEGIQLF